MLKNLESKPNQDESHLRPSAERYHLPLAVFPSPKTAHALPRTKPPLRCPIGQKNLHKPLDAFSGHPVTDYRLPITDHRLPITFPFNESTRSLVWAAAQARVEIQRALGLLKRQAWHRLQINHRGPDVAMTQQLLDGLQVVVRQEQVACVRVTKRVR